MAYTAVYVFGDSLVDAGNALKLAQWYGNLTFSDLPDGAPTADKGYYDGRFTNGYTFADLLTNKAVGTVTKPVFPYGFEDPWFGFPIAPFAGDPSGNNLNFAYGGAQVRQGDEVVQDLDSQTDTFRNAVDGDAPPGALYIVTMGGNDVRSLADNNSNPVPAATAFAALDQVADQLIHELGQLIDDGARNFLITGIADVGLIPDYDVDNNGVLDATEQMRADAASLYSEYLDNLIRTEVVPALRAEGATVTYVSMTDGLDAIMPTLEQLNGLAPGTLTTDLLTYRNLVFFDDVHPTAQVHALFGSYAQAILSGTQWIEMLPLADADYAMSATISVAGEVDKLVFALVAGTDYRFDMLGISSLATAGSLADPSLRLLTSGGTLAGANADSGAGFDAVLAFSAAGTGTYTLELSATGSLTGSYQLQASVLGGAAMQAGQTYTISNAATIVLEGAGGVGVDVVRASTSYALSQGSEIELLTTTNAKGKTAINLTGNEFNQDITGNAGANIIEGKGGADTMTGGGGKDVFVLSPSALGKPANIDRITDYAKDDLVDISQVLSVSGTTNVTGSGFLRVTTSGLIQVDLNGGGDNWQTLSTVNGSLAVNIRYLSGGTLKTVTVSRVAETSLLAASAAAAGMAAMPGSETAFTDGGQAQAGGSLLAVQDNGFEPMQLALAEPMALAARADLGFEMESGGVARHAALAERIAFEPAAMAAAEGHAPLLAATDFLAPPMPVMTADLAMPSAAMLAPVPQQAAEVARVVADALAGGEGGPDIPALLDALPVVAQGPEHGFEVAAAMADLVAFAPAMPLVGLEMLALHADAGASV